LQQFFLLDCSLICLHKVTEWQRLDGGYFTVVTSSLKEVSLLGKLWGTLQVDLDAGLGGFGLGGLVFNLALQNFLLAFGGSDVLDTNMDTLFDDSSIDQLVHTNTDGGLGNVKDNSGSTVVSLVGHTLVNGRIGKDINVITNLDFHQVLGEVNGSLLPELLGEHVTRTRPDTIGVRHGVSTNLGTKQKEDFVRGSNQRKVQGTTIILNENKKAWTKQLEVAIFTEVNVVVAGRRSSRSSG